MGLTRLLHVVRKEFLELRQDPPVQHRHHGADHPADDAWLCGDDGRKKRALVIVDQDGSAESRDLVSRFEASQSFEVIGRISSVPRSIVPRHRPGGWR